MEEWVKIDGYDGYYSISSKGRVKNNIRNRMLSTSLEKDGYVQVSLKKKGSVKTFKVHRLVSLAFIPNPENKPQVNHKNGIKADNNKNNLEWATNSENNLHSYRVLGRKHNIKSGKYSFKNIPVTATKGCFKMMFYSIKNCSEFMNINSGYISTSFKLNRPIKGFLIKKN